MRAEANVQKAAAIAQAGVTTTESPASAVMAAEKASLRHKHPPQRTLPARRRQTQRRSQRSNMGATSRAKGNAATGIAIATVIVSARIVRSPMAPNLMETAETAKATVLRAARAVAAAARDAATGVMIAVAAAVRRKSLPQRRRSAQGLIPTARSPSSPP